MKLPNGCRADLGDKLERYCLNPEHPKGKNKATLFHKRLGITIKRKKALEEALLHAAVHEEAVLRRRDNYGDYYNIRFLMKTEVGTAWVLSCWIIRKGETFPRLTNAYPIRK